MITMTGRFQPVAMGACTDMDPNTTRPPSPMPRFRYRDSRLIQIGAILFLIGPGLLLATVAYDLAMGDDHPNPVGPGILAFFLLWPSLIFLVAGVFVTAFRNRRFRNNP